KATLAHLEPSGRWDADGIQLEVKQAGGRWQLNGTKLFVPDANVADLFVVAGRLPGTKGADGVTLVLVDAKTPGVEVTMLKTMDQTRKLGEVTLKNVTVAGDAILGKEGQGWALLERVADRAKVGLAAEMCGGAQKVLEMSVEYA